MVDLENHVEKGDAEIASCDWKECSDLGNYRRCYFDSLFVICPKYLTHKHYLKIVQEMRDKRKQNNS